MKEISERMKRDNGIYFDEAKSGDPTYKIPGVEKLIENLIAATYIAECEDYKEILQKCRVWARRAHHHYYTEKDISGAMEWCNAIMQEKEITQICYDPKWVIQTPKTYSAGGGVKSNV